MESVFHNTELRDRSGASAESSVIAEHTLRECLDVTRWVEEILDARPYSDDDALAAAVMHAAHPFTDDEIDDALRHHPRIGERPAGDDAHATHALAEQSGVDLSDSDVRARLRAGNASYETRFDHVFLIRAAGRSAIDVLSELSRRMQNDAAAERAVVEHELREIAAVRMFGRVRP